MKKVILVAIVVVALGAVVPASADPPPGAQDSVRCNGCVGNEDLGPFSVRTHHLMENQVTAAKIADGSIGALKIENNAVGNDHVANNALHGDKITDGTMPGNKLASLHGSKLDNGSVHGNKLENSTVHGDKLEINTVHGNRIADGTMPGNKLESLHGDKIEGNSVHGDKLVDGTLRGGKLEPGTVGATQIGAGAIDVGEKIANGIIGVAHLNFTPITDVIFNAFIASLAAPDSEYLVNWDNLTSVPAGFADGTDDGFALARVVPVSAGTDPIANAQSAAAAVNGISDASETTPYIVKLGPGVYDFGGGGALLMKSWISLEGSGRDSTVITGGSGATVGFPVPVQGATLSDLTVENTADYTALRVDAPGIQVRNVTLRGGSASPGSGVLHVSATATDTQFSDMTITMLTAGVVIALREVPAPGPVFRNVVARGGPVGGIAVSNESSDARFDHSELHGTYRAIANVGGGGTTLVGGSMVDGPVVNGLGNTLTCAASWNASYAALSNSCA